MINPKNNGNLDENLKELSKSSSKESSLGSNDSTLINPKVKRGLMIFSWVVVALAIIGFLSNKTPQQLGEQSFAIIGLVFGIIAGWYYFSSFLADKANKRHRNPTWAYGYGVVDGWFGLFAGLFLVGIYWLALWIIGDRK